MKLYFRFIEPVIFPLLFAGAIILYSREILDISALIASLASIGTIYYGSLEQKMDNDAFFRELFKSFNERYDKKINDLINELRKDRDKNPEGADRNLLIDYFNLCSEEFLWKKKNRIPEDVWAAWKSGMIENLSIPQVRAIYDEEMDTLTKQKSYYGLFEELKIS